ncbi:MAG: tannase/feruloyl esterase family alpha/beta hydrolase [Pseudomonadales bacterium]|nr:tannase/feruloyl esterase family alpha/beta hydrolase [Pseudomonadales bacterium]MDP7596956.1 tannase/feruloyl esterase family alpha/beta hydrolase [Pseudomonadales bacterium]HJN50864.1 tannase/feruloyl esterase family alpha/beta hydrolase [Pseudomonadales bacterium]
MSTGHYQKPIGKSYFTGCSNAGRQALGFAQRYPNDFTGTIAVAPALSWTGVAAAFVSIQQGMHRTIAIQLRQH